MKSVIAKRVATAAIVATLSVTGMQKPAQAEMQTPAQASVPWDMLVNGFTGMVAAIQGGVGSPAGANVIQWWQPSSPSGAQQDQQWTVQTSGPSSLYFTIRNAGTSNWFALSVNGNSYSNGASLVQYWYSSGNAFQEWDTDGEPKVIGGLSYFRWKNRGSGKCMALAGTNGGATKPPAGAQIIQYTCGSGTDQYWRRKNVS